MADIGSLVVDIKARTAGFLSGISKSQIAIAAFTTAAIAGMAKLGHAIGDSIDKLSDLADNAERLDTGVPALQRLQYAAEQSGMSAGAMDNALKKLNISIGRAQQEGGAAEEAFTRLGLSANKLASMRLDERYIAISEAIKKLPTSTEQAAAAVDIFGRSGVTQLNLLKEDVGALTTRFDKLGGVISTSAAKSVEGLGDKIADVRVIWDGFINRLTVSLVEPMNAIVDFAIETELSFKRLQPFFKLLADISGITLLTGAFGSFANMIDHVIIKLEQMLRLSLAAPKVAGAVIGGIQSAIGLGDNASIQSLFNADQALASDIAARQQSIATGVRGIQDTPKQKVDVTVNAGKGLIVDVVSSDPMTTKIDKQLKDMMAAESARSGIR